MKNYNKLILGNYNGLNLTNTQAGKIFCFEQECMNSLGNMSQWEEWECEWSTFKGILSEEQFKTYNKMLASKRKQWEKTLEEEDEERICEIEYYKDLLWFVEDSLLPDLKSETRESGYLELNPDRAKIIFLRSEYRSFLKRTKEKMLIDHFRHNRFFQPNGFQSLILQNELRSLLPDYWTFRHEAGTAVKAVIEYLNENPRRTRNDELLMARKLNEFRAIHEQSLKKAAEYFTGWNVITAKHSEEQQREERLMLLMLIDKTGDLLEEVESLKEDMA